MRDDDARTGFDENDLLPISALQHLLFCERQCALIHIEGVWLENRLTVEGRQLHERADTHGVERRPGVRIVRGLQISSRRWGLVGRADVVEFHLDDTVKPIEYKRGRPKRGDMDRVQLCAQALCLEEMLDVRIEEGELFYWAVRKRLTLRMDGAIRGRTLTAINRLHELVRAGTTPPALREAKCSRCSLVDVCLPGAASGTRNVRRYMDTSLESVLTAGRAETGE
jgi:CRISPR-associated exonuclease Cas4